MESPPSPSRSRRKSSFFPNRQSLQESFHECDNKYQSDDDEHDISQMNLLQRMCFGFATQEDHELIKKHIKELNDETVEWKTCYSNAKSELKEAKSKHLSNLCPTINWKESQKYLTEEDKRFLKEKPDYNQYVKKVDELSESVMLLGREKQISDHVLKQTLQTLQDHKMKEELCNIITHDSNSAFADDDSGNYSMFDLLQDSEMEVEDL